MSATRSFSWPGFLPSPLALQAAITGLVLLLALAPASGGTALYLPLGAQRQAETVAWSQTEGARLVAPGPYEGAFIVRLPDDAHGALASISDGAVLLAVPEFLCGTPISSQRASRP